MLPVSYTHLVFASSVNISRCSFVKRFGTCTCTVNTKSPYEFPFILLKPLFLMVNLVPDCVPSGILYISCFPSTIGIFKSAPKVACVNVIGISQSTLSPLLVYILCFFTCTLIYKSPFGPPCSPGDVYKRQV